MADRRVVLITGGSRGIGAASAVHFARAGYNVALVARSKDALRDVAGQVEAEGVEALALPGDVSDLEYCRGAVEQTAQRWGRLDVLVNNAAWRTFESMRTISVENWEKTVRICLTAPAFLARWAAKQMESAGRGGVILNISSMMSRQAAGNTPAYVACKGALDSLTYELATLYGPVNIRVVAINPGWIDTEMSGDYVTPDGRNVTAELTEKAADMVPLRRAGTPDEIAAALVWVASDQASYVTGTRFVIDGGWQHQHNPYSLKKLMLPGDFP